MERESEQEYDTLKGRTMCKRASRSVSRGEWVENVFALTSSSSSRGGDKQHPVSHWKENTQRERVDSISVIDRIQIWDEKHLRVVSECLKIVLNLEFSDK